MLLAFMPRLDRGYTNEEKKKKPFVRRRRQLLHQCFDVIREELLELANEPVRLTGPDGAQIVHESCMNREIFAGAARTCWIFLAGIINDFPEACRTCLTFSGKCSSPCYVCLCPYNEMSRADKLARWELRTDTDSEARHQVWSRFVHDRCANGARIAGVRKADRASNSRT